MKKLLGWLLLFAVILTASMGALKLLGITNYTWLYVFAPVIFYAVLSFVIGKLK